MSSLRTHDDTWDIKTSVGSTAVMVAAARAIETEQPDALIHDPYARLLVNNAGSADLVGGHARPVGRGQDRGLDRRIRSSHPPHARLPGGADPLLRLVLRRCRRRRDPAGRDSRVGIWIRAPTAWTGPPAPLSTRSTSPRCWTTSPRHWRKAARLLRPIVARWRSTCGRIGPPRCVPPASTRLSATAWLAEGLLMYLPAEAQDKLFTLIGELSPAGSRVSAETAPDARRGAAPADARTVPQGGRRAGLGGEVSTSGS